MKLYILRHGLAQSLSESKASTDAERPLADLGREDIRAMARHLSASGASVEAILSSPLLRARQTAEEAAKILQPKSGVSVFDPLSNHIPGSHLYQALQDSGPKLSEILIVGHQPQLGEMVEHLIGSSVDIRPGGLVAIEIVSGAAPRLLWNKNP